MRKGLVNLLLNRPMAVTEIARALDRSPSDVEDDLEHLFKSLKHMDFTAFVTPAICRKCGFEFGTDKLRKPSRCPECRSTWLTEPVVGILSKGTHSGR
jgi:transcriptional regulator